MRVTDDAELVGRSVNHGRRLDRLEALGTPAGAIVHHTLVIWCPGAAGGDVVARFRILPGSGHHYVPTSWAIMGDVAGDVTFDILRASTCPPAASACGGNKPEASGAQCANGNCAGWSNWSHGDWIVVEVEALATFTEVGLSIELEPG